MKKPKICVVGASNFDLITYVDCLPKRGETVFGHNFQPGFGGKGANQAVIASKLGADVTIITKLGRDMYGEQTLENYKNLNIHTQHIEFTSDAPSGVAPIWVDKEGYNSIIVVSGANDLITLEEIERAEQSITDAQILICQNEIPFEMTLRALQIAKSKNVTTIWNPSPANAEFLKHEILQYVDILCPNETEATLLTGIAINTVEDAHKASQNLLRAGVKTVILTLGQNGCIITHKEFSMHVKAHVVDAVDTSGAGDCFLGSFAYFYGLGLDIQESVKRAQYVAAQSVQKQGTQSSYPNVSSLPAEIFH